MKKTESPLSIIYLLGIKHSGKTSVGRYATHLLAKKCPMIFVDTDDRVLNNIPEENMSIRDYYRTYGQSSFQALEVSSLSQYIFQHSDVTQTVVISTGGGACDNLALVDLMKRTGTLLYLSVSEPVLFERIMRGGIPPFLSSTHPSGSFHELYTRRDGRYRQISDYVVSLSDCHSVQENAELLASFMKKLWGSERSCQEIPLEQQSPLPPSESPTEQHSELS